MLKPIHKQVYGTISGLIFVAACILVTVGYVINKYGSVV